LVQIDLKESKESIAKRNGTQNFKDLETKKVRHCRSYPLVQELLKGGWPGAMIMVGPTQVEKFLDKNEEKYFWYQMEVNLLHHFLTGPFDFMRDPMWTIPDEVWNTLVEKAADMESITSSDVSPFCCSKLLMQKLCNRHRAIISKLIFCSPIVLLIARRSMPQQCTNRPNAHSIWIRSCEW
jgi:hypothetical protein